MSWCIIACKPSHTLDLLGVLQLHHLRVWTPTVKMRIAKPKRCPEITKAVLPGYIFIDSEHLPYADDLRKRKLVTAFERVRIDNRLVLLRKEEISRLKVRTRFPVGQRVCFAAGPYRGICGIVEGSEPGTIRLNMDGIERLVPPFLLDPV